LRNRRPSSCRIITAVLVMGFVIEAILKMVSFRMGTSWARSIRPQALKNATLPCRATSATDPASCCCSTKSWNSSLTRSSRSEERPTFSGLALGRLSAETEIPRMRTIAIRVVNLLVRSDIMGLLGMEWESPSQPNIVRFLDYFKCL